MRELIRRLVLHEEAEDLIEYGLLAAFVASVALVAIITDPLGLKPALIAAFDRVKSVLDAQ